MKISLNSLADKLVWTMTVVLLTFFVLFENIAWGRYVFFGVTLIVAICSVIKSNGKLKVKIQAYHGLFAVFILFVLISYMWAWSPADATGKAVTLVQILACSSILYIYYQEKDNIHALLTAVMWAGYLVALYTIVFYGVDNFGADVEVERLENDFANVNNIALAVALSCVLQFNEVLHKQNRWSVIMLIPAIYVVAATQSRKAFVFMIVGIYAVYIFKTLSHKGGIEKILKVLVYTVLFCVGAYLLLQLPAFKGVMGRMEAMFRGEDASSAGAREEMIKLGWDYFKQHPIGGIGIGSSHIITMRHMGKGTYLHNNFVELLSCGGIIGFVCYYASYAYLFVNLIKYRKADLAYFAIGFTWLCIMFAMHYGMVAYASKGQWYYLMIHFLNVENLKRKAMEMQNECKKIA